MWSAGTHMPGVGCLSDGHFGSLSSSNKLAQAHVHSGCRDLMAVRGQVFSFQDFARIKFTTILIGQYKSHDHVKFKK